MDHSELKLGMQPFWFWNGDMREEEIVNQIRDMKAKGIPGFLIHPRQGMEIPYMSRDFFDRVKLAVRTAKENDMEVWLYDEYPYPSGVCGGEVILDHPEYRCKRLKRVERTVNGGEKLRLFAPWGKVILARAYRITGGTIHLDDYIDLTDYVGTGYQQEVFQYSGLTKYNKKRYFTGDPGKLLSFTPPEGEWHIYLVTEVYFDHFKYFGNFIDTMNPKAVEYFIQLTHERYKAEIGEEFGKTVKGFFSDEVTAFPARDPWSDFLLKRIEDRFGFNLVDYLPALWEDLGEISARVRYAYWSCATDAFIDSYDKAVYRWCEQNHLLYIGEKPIMRSKELEYVHVPGIDTGHQKAGSAAKMISERYRANGKLASSGAHFYDKPAVLCEAGHSIGWGMTMQDLKWIFDWLSVQGIDYFIIHGFFYTTDGLKKHDAPPSAFYQMPWWHDAAGLTAYARELSGFIRDLKKQVNILALDPVTSVWTSEWKEQMRLQEDFAALQNAMLQNGLEYYVIDPELFATGEVLTEQGTTKFYIHGEKYECILLPLMKNIEQCACGKLLEYIDKGGKVIAYATMVFEQIENSADYQEIEKRFGLDGRSIWSAYVNHCPAESVRRGNLYYTAEPEEAIRIMQEMCPLPYRLDAADGLGKKELIGIYGSDRDNREVLFLVNTSGLERTAAVSFHDGEARRVSLSPYESRKIYPEAEKEKEVSILSLDEEMEYTPGNLNALRLAEWRATLEDSQTANVEACPVIDQMEAAGFKTPVTQKRYFGCPKELEFNAVTVQYEAGVRYEEALSAAHTPVYLVMEPGTFLGEWEICVNGQKLQETDFEQRSFYLKTNLAADISDMLLPGANTIRVKVTTEDSYGGMRNPLYLLGKFGVMKENGEWRLTRLPRRVNPYQMGRQGFPNYYGSITFQKKLAVGEKREGVISLCISDPACSDSIRIRVKDYETGVQAWKPYLFEIPADLAEQGELQLEITLRNTALGLFEGQYYNREADCYEKI